MTTKAELRRKENLAKRKPIDHIAWEKDKVNFQITGFVKTVETLTAELNRMHKERDEFMSRLQKHCLEWEVCSWSSIDRIAKEVFKR